MAPAEIMKNVDVRHRMLIRKGREPQVLITIALLPRGSGNRNKARALGQAFREHPQYGRHVKRVVVGSSSVRVYLVPSLDLWREVLESITSKRPADMPGQLPLF